MADLDEVTRVDQFPSFLGFLNSEAEAWSPNPSPNILHTHQLSTSTFLLTHIPSSSLSLSCTKSEPLVSPTPMYCSESPAQRRCCWLAVTPTSHRTSLIPKAWVARRQRPALSRTMQTHCCSVANLSCPGLLTLPLVSMVSAGNISPNPPTSKSISHSQAASSRSLFAFFSFFPT